METWEAIRLRCRRDGERIKVVARDLGIAPNTVRKYLRGDGPPKRTPAARLKRLDAYVTHIDELIRSTPKITAVRVGSYLRQNVDPELAIKERALRAFIARRKTLLVPKEAFVRATYAPGDQAQFDFTPMSVILGDVVTIVQLFVVRLSYSGRSFARASLHCDQPSLFAGLLAGFTAFGGLPRRALFDNASTAVRRILRGRDRDENTTFVAFRGALALAIDFAAPAKGNEKGGVEGINGYFEDNFFRPTPSYANLDDLNVALAAFCDADEKRVHTTHHEVIGERFAREQAALLPLPVALPRPCVSRCAKINKFSEITFANDIYSVPSSYAHRHAVIEIYEQRIRIIVESAVVAEYPRGSGKGERFLDPRHYLDLLQHKHRAAESALVLADGRIPAVLSELLDRYRMDDLRLATKHWTKVLALMGEAPIDEVAQTVTHALARGTHDPDAITLLLRQRRSPCPPAALDSRRIPAAARCSMITCDLTSYATTTLMEVAS